MALGAEGLATVQQSLGACNSVAIVQHLLAMGVLMISAVIISIRDTGKLVDYDLVLQLAGVTAELGTSAGVRHRPQAQDGDHRWVAGRAPSILPLRPGAPTPCVPSRHGWRGAWPRDRGFDATDGENDPAPTQVLQVGPKIDDLILAALGLVGPFLMVLGVFLGQGVVVTVMVCTVILIPLGFVVGITVATERRHNRQFDAFGMPTTAEITEMTQWDTGDDGRAVVVLGVRGPGFQTFEVTWKRSQHPALRVGLPLDAAADLPCSVSRCDRRYAVALPGAQRGFQAAYLRHLEGLQCLRAAGTGRLIVCR